MDFKQSNKPKKVEWIEDYKLQLCAYAEAHNEVYGTKIRKGVVLMAVKPAVDEMGHLKEDPLYQEFICLLYTSPSPRDRQKSRMPSSA